MSEALQIKSLAPILVVSAIEPCLEFWEKIGFSATVTVPDAPPFGFAIVAREGIEVMLQTRESVKDDTAGIADRGTNSILYVSVAALPHILWRGRNFPAGSERECDWVFCAGRVRKAFFFEKKKQKT
jgi:hypothetical protein